MSKKVICIDDKKQPIGAELVKGTEYEVEYSYVNGYDQICYIIKGIVNEGRTQYGLPWSGYRSDRFADVEDISIEEKEVEFALN